MCTRALVQLLLVAFILRVLRVVILPHCRLTNLRSGLGHQIIDENKCQMSAMIGSGQGGVPRAQGCDVSNLVP